MNVLAISFSLKEQHFVDIENVLQKISDLTHARAGKAILLNGFMPRHVVLDKGFGTGVVDSLDAHFPVQMNFYFDGKPQRELMANALLGLGGVAIIVGKVIDGVRDEMEYYQSLGIHVSFIPLDIDTITEENIFPPRAVKGPEPIPVILPTIETVSTGSLGDILIRPSFNPSSNGHVHVIKKHCAEVINFIDGLAGTPVEPNEKNHFGRWKSLAVTNLETACMYAVKAATTKMQ